MPPPVPGNPRPPTCHLGGPGRTDLAAGQEGRRPGGCGNFPPGARSTGWLERPAQPRLLQAGSQARTPTHERHRRARAPTLTHPHSSHSHSQAQPQSPSAAGQRDPNAPSGVGGDSAATGSEPRGRSPPPRARPGPAPAPLPEPEASAWSPVPAAPRAGLPGYAVNPRGQPSPALRPPLGRRREPGHPLRPPRLGPARGREVGEGSTAAEPRRPKIQAVFCRVTGDSQLPRVSRRLAPAPRTLARPQGPPERGSEGGPKEQRGRQPPPSPPSFFAARST